MNRPWIWYVTPFKRMLLGFGAIITSVIGVIVFVITTIIFVTAIGFLWTAFAYLLSLLAFIIVNIIRRVRSLGHKYSTVREWNIDNAYLSGSTARYGEPHDHGSFNSRRKNLNERP